MVRLQAEAEAEAAAAEAAEAAKRPYYSRARSSSTSTATTVTSPKTIPDSRSRRTSGKCSVLHLHRLVWSCQHAAQHCQCIAGTLDKHGPLPRRTIAPVLCCFNTSRPHLG